MDEPGEPIDRITQTWVRATGRAHDWLAAEAVRAGGRLVEGGGLLGDFGELGGHGFDPSLLAEPVVDFYENTSQ